MATGKPAIGTPASADREWQLAINNIRERFQALEAQVAALQRISGKEDIAQSIRSLQQQLTQLAKQIIALGGEADTLLPDLLTHANGIVVLKDGRLITRAIQVTDSLTIDNPAGQDGNPIKIGRASCRERVSSPV